MLILVKGVKNETFYSLRIEILYWQRWKSLWENQQELKQRLDSDGYPVVTLGNKRIKRKVVRVHRLVGKYFVDNPLDRLEIIHKDGNKQNNHFSNLEWCTRSENVQHAYDMNLRISSKGSQNGRSILTEPDIPYIFDLYAKGWSKYKIAKKFGVGWTTINHVLNKDTWNN